MQEWAGRPQFCEQRVGDTVEFKKNLDWMVYVKPGFLYEGCRDDGHVMQNCSATWDGDPEREK